MRKIDVRRSDEAPPAHPAILLLFFYLTLFWGRERERERMEVRGGEVR